jgi:hypothetical protein
MRAGLFARRDEKHEAVEGLIKNNLHGEPRIGVLLAVAI